LLDLTEYFGEHIYGALDDYRRFSKQMVIERLLRENHLRGEELLGFGDGFVEIEKIKRIAGRPEASGGCEPPGCATGGGHTPRSPWGANPDRTVAPPSGFGLIRYRGGCYTGSFFVLPPSQQ